MADGSSTPSGQPADHYDVARDTIAPFQATGARILRSAEQAPRMNATCERLVGTSRREILDRLLILGERHLRAVLAGYQAHYNTARPHQGIAQRIPDNEGDAPRVTATDLATERIRREPVLNNEYMHAAASAPWPRGGPVSMRG